MGKKKKGDFRRQLDEIGELAKQLTAQHDELALLRRRLARGRQTAKTREVIDIIDWVVGSPEKKRPAMRRKTEQDYLADAIYRENLAKQLKRDGREDLAKSELATAAVARRHAKARRDEENA